MPWAYNSSSFPPEFLLEFRPENLQKNPLLSASVTKFYGYRDGAGCENRGGQVVMRLYFAEGAVINNSTKMLISFTD
jgi:hypothetical protein